MKPARDTTEGLFVEVISPDRTDSTPDPYTHGRVSFQNAVGWLTFQKADSGPRGCQRSRLPVWPFSGDWLRIDCLSLTKATSREWCCSTAACQVSQPKET